MKGTANSSVNSQLQEKKKKVTFDKIDKSNRSSSVTLLRKSQSQIQKQKQLTSPLQSPKKQRSLLQISKSFSDRIKVDREVRAKFEQFSDEKISKKLSLENKISEIKRKNAIRLKELQQFEEKHLKKINSDYQRDREREEKLIEEYESVLSKKGRIKETQKYRKEIEKEDWEQILREKQKLEKMIREYQKKQDVLVKSRDPDVLEKIKEEVQRKIAEKEKIVGVAKAPKMKGDAKKMGNEYLKYAKKLKDMPKEKKVQLLDVNSKCIDYGEEMASKIARNTGDLSKVRAQQNPVLTTVQSGKFASKSSVKEQGRTMKKKNSVASIESNKGKETKEAKETK